MRNGFISLFYLSKKKKFNLIGLSILRIVIGVHVLWLLFLAFPIKRQLWGSYFLNPTVEFLHNDILLNVFYILGFIIMIMYTCGYSNFIFNIIVYLFVYILYSANSLLGDGGSNILIIVLFYLIFTDNSRYFSFFKVKKKQHPLLNITHNLFLTMTLIQVCILYFFAGFYKIQGSMWLNGTALYYILNIDSFSMVLFKPLINIITNSPFLLTFGAYTAIFMQLFFPLIVFNKYFRYLVLIGSICFHLSIILFMGLVQFGLIMIALDILFIKDNEFKNLKRYFQKMINITKKVNHYESSNL